MGKVLTISGQKGGSGKSVTAVNLAVSLALYEKKVLLLDCDPQGCATDWSGAKDRGYSHDLSSVFNAQTTMADAIVKTPLAFLDILPAGFGLFPVSLQLAKTISNQKILRLFLEDIQSSYEYIIIDSPSSYGFLSVAALTAADWLVIAMTIQGNSAEEFQCLLKLIKYIRNTHGTPLKIAGLLFNRCKTKDEIMGFLADQNLSEVRDLVYPSFIPSDPAVKQSIDLNLPLALYDIKSPAASAYLGFTKEVVSAFK